MSNYLYLACDKCRDRTDAGSKSGDMDAGPATHLVDSDGKLPTFNVKHL